MNNGDEIPPFYQSTAQLDPLYKPYPVKFELHQPP